MKDPKFFVSIILFSITFTRHLMSFQVWMSWLRCQRSYFRGNWCDFPKRICF